MYDLTIELEDRPGALADIGETLGRAGVSVEGGGAWVIDGRGIAHFLVEDGLVARQALEGARIKLLAVREVLLQRLNQEEPGQLGKISRKMADAGVNIEVLYSDHDHQLILVVDNLAKGRVVSEAWMREQREIHGTPESRHPKLDAELHMKQHNYEVRVEWTGNDGEGTKTYKSYRRDHTIASANKPPIQGSSDPSFRGDRSRYNPEELLVASLSSCHMLWYLHLCSVNGIAVLEYTDDASGIMQENNDGSGEFVEVTLRPIVTVRADDDQARATALHDEAHRLCFIAKSVRFPVRTVSRIEAMQP